MLQELGSLRSRRLEDEDVASHVIKYPLAGKVSFGVGAFGQFDVGVAAPFGGAAKRCFDLALSVLLLPVVAIVALPIAGLVAFDGGKVIYGHPRVGWRGSAFRCYKFRTMNAEAENELERILEHDPTARQQWLDRFKLENDPRVTPLGRWLRKTYLDEIPQIWNVLRGDMSWVGPRPVVSDELHKYGRSLPAYLACRPGISGLWQVNRRDDMSYDQRVAFDIEYAGKWSVARDLMILFLTIPRILLAKIDG